MRVVRVVRVVLAVVVVLIVGCGEDDPEAAPVTTEQVTATTATTEQEQEVIPGLAPVDVYGNLEDRGWECDGPISREPLDAFDCFLDGSLAQVTITTTSGGDVIGLFGEVYDPVDYEWLAFLATAPYEGSEPDAARAWVEENVAAGSGEETFGGVTYRLESSAEFRRLVIGG